MATATVKAVFEGDIQKVWNTVTDVENYTWRSDLSKTEILNEKQFVEYTKDGYATTVTITVTKPCERWEFDKEYWMKLIGLEFEFLKEGKDES